MSTKHSMIALMPLAPCAGTASAQEYPPLDKVASKVIAKYQGSSCEQAFSCGLLP